MGDNNATEVVAKAIYDALKEADPTVFIEDFSLDEGVAVDGRFHFRALAAILLIHLNGQLGQKPFLLAQTLTKKP